MKLPKIDLSNLPDLGTLTGMFGSPTGTPGHDDTIIVIATIVYESGSPTPGL
ncbi:hypothetical protein [Aurantiacibacter gangjinensis]|uniref:hypothetical protein n=1 Tax=Aurantiacibacter gangjinensis TaxID=502682 RepID=UPI00090B145D|nr:hypothetical protein [Aurantiacibacter gangjinensis]APE28186.1 hypothetical protein BMF35_a1357 [Aurantiacibacter gangjinensis]